MPPESWGDAMLWYGAYIGYKVGVKEGCKDEKKSVLLLEMAEIQTQLEKAEAENARLREYATKLKAGNANLRELVRDMWHEGAFEPGAGYVKAAERLEERTRELGIEVD